LRDAGERVALHSDHFDQDAPDVQWVREVGRRGWAILTKDRHIKSNQIEIASLIEANTACFNLISANLTGAQMAGAFLVALSDIKELINRIEPPFVANVTLRGAVSLLFRYTDLIKRLD
jgi:hypothetical protein